MANFKIGEKVAYIGVETGKTFRTPQKHEIITIVSIDEYSVDCEPYLYGNNGLEQSFYFHEIRKLDYQFTDALLRRIKEEQLTLIQ